jgi:hypothetical protein
MKTKYGIIFVIITTCVAVSTTLASFTEQQKITSTPRGVGAQHGNAIAISGDTMVVGARFDSTTASQAGAAFVYVLNGGTWTQQAMLLANDGAVADKFGYSVAISGDTIVVGSYNDDAPLSNGGSAYVFVRSGTTWTFQQKLAAAGGTADDEFGFSVAIGGETVFVGAHFADLPGNSQAGSVYIFRRSGTTWAETQKLVPTAAVILGDHFGESVAFSGGKIAIGASGDDTPETAAGAVYVFAESGGTYVLQQKLTILGGTNGDRFGNSVALEGDTLVGGAREDAPFPGQTARGSAYVFEFSGATWVSQGQLLAGDGASFDRFGYSVAVSNNVIAVGAREDDTFAGPDAGSAYLFKRAGATWTQQQKLTPSDPFNGDRFGASVALSFGNLVIGASEKALSAPNGQGAAYYYAPALACSSFNFSPATNFNSGVFPDAVAVADFNLDGKPDLVTANGSDSVSVLLGNGAGSFGAAANFSVGSFPRSVAVGDFNLDGKPDLATANNGSDNVSVLQGNGAGSFGTAVNFSVGISPVSVAVGDFNLDGKPDLATANSGSDNVSVLLGNGAGSFGTAVNFSVGISPVSVAVGDFNLDGKPDLTTANPSSNNASVLLGNGAGSFGAATNFSVAIAPLSVAVADFNLDGKPDLATANAGSDNVSVLLGNGAGSFGAPANFSVENEPWSVAVGDFNLDDEPDLAVANVVSNNISVLLGDGAGSFGAATNFSVVNTPLSVAMGDFNNDGKPDLAAPNNPSNNISVLLNTCGRPPAPTAFDFDGDGKSDISIFRPLNGQWWYQRSIDNTVPAFQFGTSTDKPVPADYDGDGKTDIAVFRPSTGEWFVLRSSNLTFFSVPFGLSTDKPAPGDFDGDGLSDIVVFRSSEGTWYINKSSGGTQITQWGAAGDIPVTSDYDGDGKSDFAIYRPSNGQWWLNRSTAGTTAMTFGSGTDKPVPVDYTGDGKTDVAVWRPGNGSWYVLRSEDSSFFAVPFGLNGDIPVAADYDGDGRSDFAVFRPDGGNWYIQRSTAGILIQQFGLNGDIPAPASFVP